MTLSYKPQYLDSESYDTVEQVLTRANPASTRSSFFKTELIRPLNLEGLISHQLDTLSGGELQKVGIATCLAKEADLYLIDEPSAFISAEDRVMIGKTIRRMIMHRRAAGFVIEHDLMLQSYVSDRIIHFTHVYVILKKLFLVMRRKMKKLLEFGLHHHQCLAY